MLGTSGVLASRLFFENSGSHDSSPSAFAIVSTSGLYLMWNCFRKWAGPWVSPLPELLWEHELPDTTSGKLKLGSRQVYLMVMSSTASTVPIASPDFIRPGGSGRRSVFRA